MFWRWKRGFNEVGGSIGLDKIVISLYNICIYKGAKVPETG